MEVNFRFKPTDFVRLKHSPNLALCINETLSQTCPAGTQLHYKGDIYKWERNFLGKSEWDWMLAADNKQFLEHELGEIVPDTKTESAQ